MTMIASPGSMHVDWEERWNVDRLRAYRSHRARSALDASEVGAVLLFDFGAQVAGYRSDMTRTLFVGPPESRDLEVYGLVAAGQAAAIQRIEDGLVAARHGAPLPTGRELDVAARGVIDADGRWPAYGHGLGHGIGLATHELPSLGRRAPDTALPSPTVFSVEPGIYLPGRFGMRTEIDVFLGETGPEVTPLQPQRDLFLL